MNRGQFEHEAKKYAQDILLDMLKLYGTEWYHMSNAYGRGLIISILKKVELRLRAEVIRRDLENANIESYEDR